MTTFDRINELCKERGISITALETELGFGRGSIGKLKKGTTMSSARLQKIADRLETTTDYLLNGVQENAQDKAYYKDAMSAMIAQQMFEDPQLHALHHVKQNIDPKRFQAFYDMIVALYKAENPDDNYDFNGDESPD